MKYNIRTTKIELTDAIRNYIESKLGKLDKYFENPSDLTANVLLKEAGINQVIEVTIPIKKAFLRAEVRDKDLYAAIDLVIDKLERQIRKNKTRIKSKNNNDIMNSFIDFDVNEEDLENTNIVKRKDVDAKPMDEEEAILEMNLLGHDFFVFKNINTDTISVVYKRKDEQYGIINMK